MRASKGTLASVLLLAVSLTAGACSDDATPSGAGGGGGAGTAGAAGTGGSAGSAGTAARRGDQEEAALAEVVTPRVKRRGR